MIQIDEDINIPTCLRYNKKGEPFIGLSAQKEKDSEYRLIENFKIELGNVDSKKIAQPKKINISKKNTKTVIQITSDFFRKIFNEIKIWLENNNISSNSNLLIAEPLSLQVGSGTVSNEWLTNYRANLKRLLSGQFYNIKNISFMPEPFAVFQYYRYGYKHPLLSAGSKNNVLVVDFGGGTFDVCIIETTKEGDVRKGGKHSRPLAAASEPVGGFYVNRVIAEHLLFEYAEEKTTKTKLRKGINQYNKWKKGENGFDFSTLHEDYQTFIKKFDVLIYTIERPKIDLSNFIKNWSLDANLNESILIDIPENIFDENNCNIYKAKLTANKFREIFTNEVWVKKLKPIIKKTIDRGKNEFLNENISVALLSGGSSNIKWLRILLEKDFKHDLEYVEIFDLPNYQEVVSQGLSIECARRFYNEEKEGDFSSVTYNRICLLLSANSIECEPRKFKPKTKGLPTVEEPAVLLPSASVLKNFIDKELKWRVKLNKRPTKSLDYYFLRSTLNYEDLDNRFNIPYFRVFTPQPCKFDSYVTVQLKVDKNGTAIPTFIYKTDRNEKVVMAKQGNPFPLDITYAQENPSNAYIGFDFGSSNTSISFIDEKSIKIYQTRRQEEGWQDLSNLVETLPYPASSPLASYLCQRDLDKRVIHSIKFAENTLSFLSYIIYLELCATRDIKSKIFKGFTQRSAGPIWKLLQTCFNKISSDSLFCSNYGVLLNNESNLNLIDNFITQVSQFKHDKISSNEIDTERPVKILANLCSRIFEHYCFGYFEEVKKQKFKNSNSGLFRIAHGKPPFTRSAIYEGKELFSPESAILINCKKNILIKLDPLIFWESCDHHQDLHNGHCYFYDKISKKNVVNFTAINYPCNILATSDNKLSEYLDFIIEMKEKDIPREIIKIEKLNF